MLTALVIGNMVGSGVFLLPSALAQVGTITIYSWGITALGAILLALVFARLSQIFPLTGGPYIYCRQGFGDFIGFQVAYSYWIFLWTGNAAIAVTFTSYLATFWPELSSNGFLGFYVTAGVIWLFTIVNCIGVRFAGVIQLFFTVLKFVPLVLIAIIGLFFVKKTNLTEFNMTEGSNFSALSVGAMLTLWAFLGLESASIPADEVDHPAKTIAKATIFGTVITALLYILVTIAIMGVIPASVLQRSEAPFADFANILFGPWGKTAMALVAVVSCMGALNGWILLAGQLPIAAARDNLFPKHFGNLSSRRTPVFGLVVSSLLATAILLLNYSKGFVESFVFIIELATLSALLVYLYTTISDILVSLKGKGPFPWKSSTIALLAFVYAFWAAASSGERIVFYGFLLIMTSLPLYAWMKHHEKNL